MKILHVVPDSVVNPNKKYLGGTKDIRCRTEYFKARGINYDEIHIKRTVKHMRRSDRLLLKKLKSLNLSHYTTVFFEYPIYPKSMKYLKRKHPDLYLAVRSHNAEFYQQLHRTKAWALNFNILSAFFFLEGSLRYLVWDLLCARYANTLFSISRWEKENYWKYLTESSKVKYLPYFMSDIYNTASPHIVEKKKQCACVMSPCVNPFLLDSAKGFSKFVAGIGHDLAEWSFYITGDLNKCKLKLPDRVAATGFVNDPAGLLAESRAVALLSDYGFGFKTKLLDAIHFKCYLLLTRGIYKRMPAELKPYCIMVDLKSPDSFKEALEKCLLPFPEGNPNELLRKRAFTVLDKHLA